MFLELIKEEAAAKWPGRKGEWVCLRENKIMWEGTEIETEGVGNEKKGGCYWHPYLFIIYLFYLPFSCFLLFGTGQKEMSDLPKRKRDRKHVLFSLQNLTIIGIFLRVVYRACMCVRAYEKMHYKKKNMTTKCLPLTNNVC